MPQNSNPFGTGDIGGVSTATGQMAKPTPPTPVPIDPTTGQPYYTGANGWQPDQAAWWNLGGDFGYTPTDVTAHMQQATNEDMSRIGTAGGLAASRDMAMGDMSIGNANQALAWGQQQAAAQQALGQAGSNFALGQAAQQQALGQSVFGGMASLGGAANGASGYYGAEHANLLANQGDIQNAQLGSLDQFGNQLAGTVRNLQDFANSGGGMSPAEMQLRQQADANMANSISLANSGRGAGDNSAMMRQALFANAASQQQTNNQAAVIRAQETAALRASQLQALTQAGTFGIQGAGVTQNALGGISSTNAGLTGTAGNLGLGYGNLAQGYMQGGASALNAATANANNLTATGLGYSQGMEGLGNQADANGQQLYSNLYGYGNQDYQIANATGIQTAAGLAQLNQGQIGNLNDLYKFQVHEGDQRLAASEGVQIAGMQDAANSQAALISGLGTLGGGIIGGIATMGNPAGIAAGAGLGGAAAKTVGSDERMKKNIRKSVFDLRPAKGYAYEYTNPGELGAEGGVHFGPMAQDLERTPAGRSVVKQVGKRKMVDTSRLALVLTGAVSETQHEADRLAARLERLEQMAQEGSAA